MTRDDFNSVRLIGRLGRDPEQRHTASGMTVTTVSIAVGGGDKKDGGKWPTHWIDLKAFKEVAEALAALNKGSQIQLKGELTQESWEKDGVKRSKIVVIVREFEKLEKQPKSNDGSDDTARPSYSDDLEPF